MTGVENSSATSAEKRGESSTLREGFIHEWREDDRGWEGEVASIEAKNIPWEEDTLPKSEESLPLK